MLPTNTSWRMLCLLFVSQQTVSWSFVCQLIIAMLFTPSHDDSGLSNFITIRLGRMKTWAVRNSLDWVTCYPLHFTLVYIVYRESQTRQVVYIHVHYGVHWNVHWYRQPFDWFVTLLHDLFSNKKDKGLVAKPELLFSCHPN